MLSNLRHAPQDSLGGILYAACYQAGSIRPHYPVPATMKNANHATFVQYACADLDWFGYWPTLPV